ncbi:transmembrane 4 L6 family member 20-like [Erpetoichthys calabaricus]|uniref:transmembrane 4 L6 family member 20-like n=1 Tax=Erpetoichthys calabaricus TaxID=27687 RepID=UPI0010A02923|nr:transmembrane 4 L6 family member 20-like [Erpetoichthys calabaricus]
MTCSEALTSCNGYFLLTLAILAIGLNLVPLVADYATEGSPFENAISCYEWWLPGILGGGILVLPVVAMTFAAKKRGSCNSRTGMLTSALLSIVGIAGALYCVLISLYALAQGPLLCEVSQDATVESCDFNLRNISLISNVNFNMKWYFENGCNSEMNKTRALLGTGQGVLTTLDLNEMQQKNIHLIAFAGLSMVALLEILLSALQIVSGTFGCLCGTSKRRRDMHM